MIVRADKLTVSLSCHPSEPGEFEVRVQPATNDATKKCLETALTRATAIVIGDNDEPRLVRMRLIEYINNPHAIALLDVRGGNLPYTFTFKNLPIGYMNPIVEASLKAKRIVAK